MLIKRAKKPAYEAVAWEIVSYSGPIISHATAMFAGFF